MAGVKFAAITDEIASGTALKTLLQVVAAANQRLAVTEISLSCKGTVSNAVPIKMEILRQTTAGTMSSLTPVKRNDSDDETLQVTAQHTATAEPTAGDVLKTEELHPQTGWTWMTAPGEEILVGGGDRLGIRVTAAVTVDIVARIEGEE